MKIERIQLDIPPFRELHEPAKQGGKETFTAGAVDLSRDRKEREPAARQYKLSTQNVEERGMEPEDQEGAAVHTQLPSDMSLLDIIA